MTQPSVNITELDGALGVLPPTTSTMLALYGVSTTTVATPRAFGTVKALKAALVGGPLVDAAAHYIETYGNPVLCMPASLAVDGTFPGAPSPFDAVEFVGTGTSVPTIKAGSTSDNDYEVKVLVVAGGTRGTAGITYRISLDGGRTYGKTLALGTAVEFAVGDTGITVALAAGTLVAGDYFTFASYAPTPDGSVLADDLAVLAQSAQPWTLLHYVGPVDSTVATALDAFMANLSTLHKPRAWIGNAAVPVLANDLTKADDATALAAAVADMGTYETTYGTVCFGDIRFRSSLTGGRHLRPFSFLVAALTASVSEEVNVADINLGRLPAGASVYDSAGNPECHDESVSPGADDARFCVARSWPGYGGVYVNRPRLFSNDTSDFQLMPHRRVMNLAHVALYSYFVRRLNAPVQVDTSTGYILESTAREMEAGAEAALRSLLGAKPKASGWSVVVSRTDNILSTSTINVTARIIPLGYPETIEIELGFVNPALLTSAA